MNSILVKGSNLRLVLPDNEFRELGLDSGKEYELIKAREGLLVLMEKNLDPETRAIQGKIFSLLAKKKLNERVEGKFEKLLDKKELTVFRDLLEREQVIKFRLSKKYKKAIYKNREEWIREQVKEKKELEKEKQFSQESEKNNSLQREELNPKQVEGIPLLEKDGFTLTKSEFKVRELSQKLDKEIKAGQIRGTRNFDGEFCIISADLLEKESPKIMKLLSEKKSMALNEIALQLNADPQLVKVVNEFLKEDGSIIEKRKGLYKIVE